MGIAAAIGGFAEGAAKGIKLRSDLDDAEQRRGLMKIQAEGAQLQNAAARGQLDREEERKRLREESVEIAKAYATGEGAEKYGFVLDEDEFGYKKYNPNNSQNVRRNYELNKDLTRRRAIAFDRNPDADVSALEDLQKKRYQERLNQALVLSDQGDWAGFDRAMRSVYNDFEDGRQFTGSKRSEDGKNVTLYFTDEKTGQPGEYTVSKDNLANIARLGLNLNDTLTHKLKTREQDRADALANSTIDFQSAQKSLVTAQAGLVGAQAAQLPKEFDLRVKELNAKIDYMKGMVANGAKTAQAAADRATADKVTADVAKIQQSVNFATGRVIDLMNVKKPPGDLADPKEKQEFVDRLHIAGVATSMLTQSAIATNGRTVMDAGEAVRLARFGDDALKPENIERTMSRFGNTLREEAPGFFTIQYGGYRVPLSRAEGLEGPLRQAIERQSQPPAAPRAGVTAPPASQITPIQTRPGIQTPPARLPNDFMFAQPPR